MGRCPFQQLSKIRLAHELTKRWQAAAVLLSFLSKIHRCLTTSVRLSQT